jgi:hypothetical protein
LGENRTFAKARVQGGVAAPHRLSSR